MMLICIDGTGPRDRDKYRMERKDGFVRNLWEAFQRAGVRSLYLRGPNIASLGVRKLLSLKNPSQVRSLAITAEATVRKLIREGVEGPIGFAGYSRGGAACIEAVKRLRQSMPELEIEVLALFDAVDRDPLTNTDTIPNTVRFAYHAVRDGAVLSRTYFGHTGLTMEPPGILEVQYFYGTHSALGGTPFEGDHPVKAVPIRTGPMILPTHPLGGPPPVIYVPTINEEQDRAAAAQVQKWMWANIDKHMPGVLPRT